jgi:carbonic anhydrase
MSLVELPRWFSVQGECLASEICQYPSLTYFDDVQLSDSLVHGEIENACVIACSDMGASLPFVCSDPKVKLLIFQDFGHSCLSSGAIEVIDEYNLQHVIIYGHQNCEFARFRDRALIDSFSKLKQEADEDAHCLYKELARYNVLKELRTLIENTSNKTLKIHGWVYDANQRLLEVFDPDKRGFVISQSGRLS